MKVEVDKDVCISCGLCIDICPEVFEYDENSKSRVIEGCNLDEHNDEILEAKDACPVEAIKVTE